MAFHTIRDYKMQSIRDSAEPLSLHFQHDLTDLALQYGHEQTSGRRICMVGSPKLESILTVLSTSNAPEVLIILDSKNVEHLRSYKEAVQSMATALNRRVDVVVGDAETLLLALQEQYQQRRLCDTLHIEGNLAPAILVTGGAVSSDNAEHDVVTRLVNTASRIPGGEGNGVKGLPSQQQGPLRVVWVRAVTVPLVRSPNGASLMVTLQGHKYAPHNLTSALSEISLRALNQRARAKSTADSSASASPVQWKLSSLWAQHSRLNPIANHDGFTGRTYVTPDEEGGEVQQLAEVLVGEVEGFLPARGVAGDEKGRIAATARMDPLSGREGAAAEDGVCSCTNTATVIAITYTIRVFAETADGLRQALRSLGFPHVYVVPDLTLRAVNHLQAVVQRLHHNCSCSATAQPAPLLQVALGPHDFAVLLPHYVVFQMEQTWSSVAFAGRYKTRYGLVLSNALCILAYSHLHAALLRELGYPCVHVVPMFSLPAETERLRTIAETGDGTSLARFDIGSRAFDLSFYGGCSERRTRLLEQVQHQFPKCPAPPPPPQSPTPAARCFECNLHCVGWYTGVFDSTRLLHVLQSRLVLNLHTDEHSVLEAHRLNYLLSLGRCVISERSDDTLLDARYAGVVHFINEGDIAALYGIATRLLSNTTELQLCEQKSRRLYTRLSIDTQDLSLAIKEAVQQMNNDEQ